MISDRALVHWEEVIQESVGQLTHKIQHMTKKYLKQQRNKMKILEL